MWGCSEPQPLDTLPLPQAVMPGKGQAEGQQMSEHTRFSAGIRAALWDAQDWFGAGAGAFLGECYNY